jgi:hypothetical protein
MLEDLDVHF